MPEKSTKDLLGQVVDLSFKSYPRKNAGFKTGLRCWRCLFCGDEANTPPEVRHKDGCVIAQAQKHLRGEGE